MCNMVKGSWQFSHSGGCSFVSRKLCVRCAWPIRSRYSTTSKNRSWCWHVFHSPRTGLTRWSLLFVQESHCCCHFNKTARRTIRLLSFKGIFIVVMGLCAAREAHSSAFSLPGIPMWLGTQQGFVYPGSWTTCLIYPQAMGHSPTLNVGPLIWWVSPWISQLFCFARRYFF